MSSRAAKLGVKDVFTTGIKEFARWIFVRMARRGLEISLIRDDNLAKVRKNPCLPPSSPVSDQLISPIRRWSQEGLGRVCRQLLEAQT